MSSSPSTQAHNQARKGSKPVPKVIVRDPPSSSKSDPERSDSGLESDGNSEGSVVGETNSHSPTFPNARLDPKTKIQLKRAITSTSPEKMHEILHEIVDTEDALASALLPHFSAVQLSGAIAPRWIVCGVCGNEFDASTPRRKKECRWHSGKLQADWKSEVFDDYSEIHGPPEEDEEIIEEWPEAFRWSCCKRIANGRPCQKGAHVPMEANKKRKRE